MVELKLEGRAAYLRLNGELLKTEREQLEQFLQEIQGSGAEILIVDVGRCRLIDEHCIRPLVQLQSCIRSREGGNVFIVGASFRLKENLLKRGAVRAQETFESLSLIKTALAA